MLDATETGELLPLSNEWQPHYGPVSHVSSPDAFWHPEEQQVFLYFHGENTTTRSRHRPMDSRSATVAWR